MTSPQPLYGPDDPWATRGPASPRVEIVVPVRNEEHDLAPGIQRLVTYLRTSFPFTAQVTIADNGSTDGTWPIAVDLERAFSEVRAVQLAQPGRGQALRTQWSASRAEVVSYMDVDLSTDLNALLPLTRDTGWFFDTEVLILSQRAGLRIHEVPVDWIDDTDSRVDVVPTIRFCLCRAWVFRRPRPAQAALIHPEGTDR